MYSYNSLQFGEYRGCAEKSLLFEELLKSSDLFKPTMNQQRTFCCRIITNWVLFLQWPFKISATLSRLPTVSKQSDISHNASREDKVEADHTEHRLVRDLFTISCWIVNVGYVIVCTSTSWRKRIVCWVAGVDNIQIHRPCHLLSWVPTSHSTLHPCCLDHINGHLLWIHRGLFWAGQEMTLWMWLRFSSSLYKFFLPVSYGLEFTKKKEIFEHISILSYLIQTQHVRCKESFGVGFKLRK